MTMKTALAALALTLLPALTAAAACVGDHKEASMSCADGTAWDPQSRTCVATSS